MKKVLSALAAVSLLVSCTLFEKPGANQPEEVIVPVTGISIVPEAATLMEGETLTIACVVVPEKATNKQVTWSSSNESVAFVEDGQVTGNGVGSAVITAVTEDGGKSATCKVTVVNEPSITLTAEQVTPFSAVLNGKANLGTTVAADLQMGFQYSQWAGILPTNSTRVVVEDPDIHYHYSWKLTGLETGTTYYYRSFVRQDNVDYYGVTKSFTTEPVSSFLQTGGPVDVQFTTAILAGFQCTAELGFDSPSFGFLFWDEERVDNPLDLEPNMWSTTVLGTPPPGGGVFGILLTDLEPDTQYWYKVYVVLDGTRYCGEVKSFTTSYQQVESISLDINNYAFDNYFVNNKLSLVATVSPDDAKNKSLEWSSDNEDVAIVDQEGRVTALGTGTATIRVSSKDGSNVVSTCEVTVPVVYYDFGLSVKWAVCNLGASRPEDPGDYYAWGETEPKTEYTWATYKWSNGGADSLTKYCQADGKTQLDLTDDAAHVRLGGKWRMPTVEECYALNAPCDWGESNGVKGLLMHFAGGDYFLPATGRLTADGPSDTAHGVFWSSSLSDPDIPNNFAYGGDITPVRADGCPIRAVWDDHLDGE